MTTLKLIGILNPILSAGPPVASLWDALREIAVNA
jgi:hypothetical protein